MIPDFNETIKMNNINSKKLCSNLLYFGYFYLLYVLINIIYKPSGFTMENWISYLFLILSAFFLFRFPLKQLFFRKRYLFSNEIRVVFVCYTLYLIITLLRDFTLQIGVITTLFSNENALLGWLVPLSFFWAYLQEDEFIIYQYFYKLALLGIIIYIGSLSYIPIKYVSINELNILIFPLLFLVKYFKFSQKIVIYIGLVIIIFSSLLFDQRAIFLKAFILFFISMLINNNLLSKSMKHYLIIGSIILGIIGLYYTYSNSFQNVLDRVAGISAFPEFLSTSNTRDFVVTEFFDDLSVKDIVIGKGFLGTYYSHYFFIIKEGDYFERFTTEIGILTVILKGGLILCLIYFYFFISIVKFLLQTKLDKVIAGLSAYVLIEFLFMFLVNSPRYNLTDIVIWIIIGIIFSKHNLFSNSKINPSSNRVDIIILGTTKYQKSV